MRIALACLILLTAAPLAAIADPIPSAVVADPPQDKVHPSGMEAFALPVKDTRINAVLYTAAGAGPHPTVLLLHGLPGNEQNLDLARAMQRDGWNVLTLHYRGSWGSPGQFSFVHVLEDAGSALAWLRDPNTTFANRINATKLVIIGHSLGGFASAYAGAQDSGLMGVGLISAASLGQRAAMPRSVLVKFMDDNIGTSIGMHTVNTSPEALADEISRHAKDWDAVEWGPKLGQHPLLVVTSNDGLAGVGEQITKAAESVAHAPVTRVHLETNHSYIDQRITLTAAVLRWLENLPGAPTGF